jgi:hypothetical protein
VKEVYILVDGAGWLGTPTRLWRVEPRDGQIEGLDYLFDTDSWETDYGGYYAGSSPYGGDEWGYMIEFTDGHYGSVQVHDIHAALASVGARFDPDPPI